MFHQPRRLALGRAGDENVPMDIGDHPPAIPARRIVVVMPNWLGDAVMATPFLRALRRLYPEAHITAIGRPLVMPVLAGLPHVDELHECPKGGESQAARWMKPNRFDLGILLPNSFRSAWMLWRGGVKRRLGYSRGGRSLLLTDRLSAVPRNDQQRRLDQQKSAAIHTLGGPQLYSGTAIEPISKIDKYLELLQPLQSNSARSAVPPQHTPENRRMELAITDAERAEADATVSQIKKQKSEIKNLVVVVPGANFGASKCWMPDRFAALAAAIADPAGPFAATVLLAGSPAEMPIIEAILSGASTHLGRIIALPKLNAGKGVSLGALKEIVRRSRLMICNDTGPRHFAAALGTPVITLFGPTDPRWAETFFEQERIIRVEVPCGPCQLKQCPIDHRCMKEIAVEKVLTSAQELWNTQREP